MAVNTLITIKDALTKFVSEHKQLQRIEFEADDYRAPKITEGDLFPVLFVAPIEVLLLGSMNVHTLRMYVYEKINDSRDDIYENANDTSLILRDIKVWWNDFGDDDIQIIEDSTGEFRSDRELDNLVGYVADFRFEIPAHGRCDVPIDPIPPFVPICADANYIVQYEDGTLIEQGTIPSGGSVLVEVPNVITCAVANWQLTDSLGNVLDSGTIESGGSATITAPDGTNNINKSSGALIESVSVVSGATVATSIADSVITLQNTAATTLSTTNVLATDAATITAPDATINVDSIKLADVASGGTLDVQVVDSEDNPVDVTLDSPKIIINDLPCEAPEPSEPFPYVGLNNLLDPNNDFSWASPLTQAQSVVGIQEWNLFNSVGYDATTKMWTLNGVDQYLESATALLWTNKRNALSFHMFVNSGLTGFANQPFIIRSSSTAASGQFYVFRLSEPNQNDLGFRYWNNSGVLENTLFTDFFLGMNDTNMMLSVVVDYDTGEAHAYRNGVLFATETHDAKKPVTAIAQRIGRVGGSYGAFKFGVHALYNELHTATEVQAFFNQYKADYGL